MQLKNKVVIVTGSSSGIGRDIAVRFANEGSKVVINYKSNKKGAEQTAKLVKKAGADYLIIAGDLSEPKNVEKLFKDTKDKFGSIDILINNAGYAHNAYIEDTDKDHWLKSFNDNFFTTVLCSKEALKYMQKQKEGKIINIASVMGIDCGRTGIIAYSAAKAAVISFTKTLAKHVAPHILVNAVAPGRTETPYYDQFDKQTLQSFIDANPIKRMINVSEISDAVIFIAKNDAMTGSVVVVDGGFMLK